MTKKRWRNRVWCWTMFYLLSLSGCLAAARLLPGWTALSHWRATVVGTWLAVCLYSLYLPRSIWDCWMPKRKKRPWKW